MAKRCGKSGSGAEAIVCTDAADEAMVAPRISVLLVNALLDVLRRRGIRAESFLNSSELARLRDPTEPSMPLLQYQELLARAEQLTGEPSMGLQCGLHASESSFGLMSPLVGHASTLRGGVALLSRFHALLLDAAILDLEERAGVATLVCRIVAPPGIVHRNFKELMMAGLVRTLAGFGCTNDDIRAVCFEYSAPPHRYAYTEAFNGAERFSQPYTGLQFAANALDRPHLHRQRELHALLLSQAEGRLQRLSRPQSVSERVRAYLLSCSPGELPTMEAAARPLGISTRSLRRRLEEEGTSYRKLTQAVLYESACTMLRNPEVTLKAIAHSLGFADATAFHHAFRRWSSLTPVEYRVRSGVAVRLAEAREARKDESAL